MDEKPTIDDALKIVTKCKNMFHLSRFKQFLSKKDVYVIEWHLNMVERTNNHMIPSKYLDAINTVKDVEFNHVKSRLFNMVLGFDEEELKQFMEIYDKAVLDGYIERD